MERATEVFKAPSGLEIVIYTYLTAKEANEHKNVFMKAVKFDIADIKDGMKEAPMKGQVDGTILQEQEDVLVRSLVKSCPEGIENIRQSDYAALIVRLNEIKGGLTSAK